MNSFKMKSGIDFILFAKNGLIGFTDKYATFYLHFIKSYLNRKNTKQILNIR